MGGKSVPGSGATTNGVGVAHAAAERARQGSAARKRVPLAAHAEFALYDGRDPIGLLLSQNQTRLPWLVPVRHRRMGASAFAFYRGAALVMAADLASVPSSGLGVQLCGDAHLSNFGAYASPERRLVFDLNDFDETLPGPFEWDLKRLVASTALAGRANGFDKKQRRRVARGTTAAYREAMGEFARTSMMDVWYARIEADEILGNIKRDLPKKVFKEASAGVEKARARNGMQALAKLTTVVDGKRSFVSDPPLVVPIEEIPYVDAADIDRVFHDVIEGYAATLSPERRHLIEQFTLTHLAHKVVGVGSVGRRAWVLLMEAKDGMEPLLLQAKEATRSALSGYLGESEYDNQGQRVVVGQRMLQASSDVLLGWQRIRPTENAEPQDYYMRQLRDWKYSLDVSTYAPDSMLAYGRLCAWTLARAHARTGDRIGIATYLGDTDEIDRALATFAETYADVTEADHVAHQAAMKDGLIPSELDAQIDLTRVM